MTPQEYAAELEKYNFDYFIAKALDNVPEAVDKREGSIIYDALAPAAYSFAEISMNLRNLLLSTFTQTAANEFLDYRGQEKGLARYEATRTIAVATFVDAQGKPVAVDVGDRFSSIGAEPYFYTVSTANAFGMGELTCDAIGSAANHYLGQILPITPNDNLATAMITEVTVPARDAETDDDFRKRILKQGNPVAYGGNITDYQKIVAELQTVGAVQVYPIWNGGGTVKLVILNNNFDLPSESLIRDVQQAIDPSNSPGNGYGLAPIGHVVSVVAPVKRTVNVSMDLVVELNTNFNVAKAAVVTAINDYFTGLRKSWDNLRTGARGYNLNIYRSQIFAAVLKVTGVVNITNLKLNGTEADIKLVMDRTKSELPFLGEVTVNESTLSA